MRREHWLIWLAAIVLTTMVVVAISYFAFANLTVAVASTGRSGMIVEAPKALLPGNDFPS
jgi:hypothetical protein